MKTPKTSGKFVVRIEPKVHEQLKRVARAKGISLNQLCRQRLEIDAQSTYAAAPPLDGPEWRSFISDCLKQWVSPHPDIIGLVLFGSAARAELGEGSDIDLLFVLEQGRQPTREIYRSWQQWFEGRPRGLSRETNPQFISLPENPFLAGGLWYEVAIDGIVLWEKNALVSRFLRAIRKEMASGAIQRAESHGHPYWIKKKAG